jgi:prepilin-type N-terminal cleavage/methylation domain-containing protein
LFNKPLSNQSGFTLIELLASLVISCMLVGITFGVLNSSLKLSNKTQSHVNIRQEANIIISKLRQQHQGGEYSLCYESFIYNNKISFKEIKINNNSNSVIINKTNKCNNIKPTEDLYVKFTLADQHNNAFEIDTVIRAKQSVNPNVNIALTLPEKGPTFHSYIRDNNVFVYGAQFIFEGTEVKGPGATMVVKGNLNGNQINGGAFGNVSNIYIDGNANFDGGSAGLGSSSSPGKLYIKGELTFWDGTRNIYGDVYVDGNFNLKDAKIFGNVYVNGNVKLGWTPTLATNSKIYYTGSLSKPDNYNQTILTKVIKQSTVEGFEMPNFPIPQLKSDEWYKQNGYINNGTLGDNKKILVNSNYILTGKAYNVIIVSKGNVTIKEGWAGGVTGVIFAPNGKVTFDGGKFEGLVVARDGFEVSSGGTIVTFKNIDTYINNIKDYPF